MKLALMGDIHGNLPALTKVLDGIEKDSVDNIFCTGDIVGYGPQPNEVIELIRNKKINTVMGNHDDAAGYNLPVCGCNYATATARMVGEKSLAWTKSNVTGENRKFLRELPEEICLDSPYGKVLIFHGSPRAINEYIHANQDEEILDELIAEYDARIFIFGHTHIPFTRIFKERVFINAGSVGQPKDGDNRACYILAEITPNSISVIVKRVAYDIDRVVCSIKSVGLPGELSVMLRNGVPL